MRNLENRNTQNGDEQLKMFFGNLKDERLPEGFRQRMMSRIEKEAVRKSRRQLVWNYVVMIAASLSMIGTAIACVWYYDLESAFRLDLTMTYQEKSLFVLCMEAGGIVLLLLWADYRFRAWYKKRHSLTDQ